MPNNIGEVSSSASSSVNQAQKVSPNQASPIYDEWINEFMALYTGDQPRETAPKALSKLGNLNPDNAKEFIAKVMVPSLDVPDFAAQTESVLTALLSARALNNNASKGQEAVLGAVIDTLKKAPALAPETKLALIKSLGQLNPHAAQFLKESAINALAELYRVPDLRQASENALVALNAVIKANFGEELPLINESPRWNGFIRLEQEPAKVMLDGYRHPFSVKEGGSLLGYPVLSIDSKKLVLMGSPGQTTPAEETAAGKTGEIANAIAALLPCDPIDAPADTEGAQSDDADDDGRFNKEVSFLASLGTEVFAYSDPITGLNFEQAWLDENGNVMGGFYVTDEEARRLFQGISNDDTSDDTSFLLTTTWEEKFKKQGEPDES